MKQSIEILKTWFAAGKRPTGKQFSDLIDSCFSHDVLKIEYSIDASYWHEKYTEGDLYMRLKIDANWSDAIRITGKDGKDGKDGSDGTGLMIPRPVISIVKDELFYKWNSDNVEFLKHNPELWLFRYARCGKKKEKGFRHPMHYAPGDTSREKAVEYQTGRVKVEKLLSPDGKPVSLLGRSTEFPLAIPQNRWENVPLVAGDYFCLRVEVTGNQKNYQITGNTVTETQYGNTIKFEEMKEVKAFGTSRLTTQHFAAAIVIDNPDKEDYRKKIIGACSEGFTLSFLKDKTKRQFHLRIAMGRKLYKTIE